MAPQWRLMKAAHTEDPRAAVERITVRLPDATIKAIDAACSKRVGNVSRNTWILEAVQEKLSRVGDADDQSSADRGSA